MNERAEAAAVERLPAGEARGEFRTLSPDQIVRTMESVLKRIETRFPGSGLGRVCRELLEIGLQAESFTASLSRPIYPIRVFSWLLIIGLVTLSFAPFFLLDATLDISDLGNLVQMIEASLNDLVLIGLAILFLATWERRVKRRRVLKALSELRSIAHVVDMHQLAKDPKIVLGSAGGADDPELEAMSRADLAHYLDYCSEVLSLTSKLAALYLEAFDDSVVIGTVNEVGNLVAGLSRKIWQKIMILDRGILES
ncbi:MAG: hypothetical protein JSV10_01480 [Candidatus Zixiibacteriota bacterium]|nr:MAG: hypothetical protein JSV10_01480 [candidate division Zixibacteria bacterium]